MRYLLILCLLSCAVAKPVVKAPIDPYADEPKDPDDNWEPAIPTMVYVYPPDPDGGLTTGPCRTYFVNGVKHEDCD